jgi:hypothetical protein
MQPHMRGGSQRLNVLENSDGGKLVGENRAAAAAPYLKLVLGRKRAKRERATHWRPCSKGQVGQRVSAS